MITTSELIDTLWSHLKASPLNTVITGGIYKRKRPQSSTKEDVVINSLALNNEQLQEGVLNVNVFVPDLKVSISGSQEYQPDSARLLQLERIACDALEDVAVNGKYIFFDIQTINTFSDDNATQHFINIRLNFFIPNI